MYLFFLNRRTGTNWHSTENHQTDQPDCVAIEVYFGKWIPQSCQQAWGWICEIPRGTYTTGELIQNFPSPVEANRKFSIKNLNTIRSFIQPR